MKITKFEKLLSITRQMGAEKSIDNLIKIIDTGQKEVDPNELVYGSEGIYYVDPRGVLTRVILHITDKNINSRYFPDDARSAVESEDFDDDYLIKKIHKYHLVNCQTLRQAENQGWRDKYRVSRRRDGLFFYRFTNGNEVLYINEEQRMHVCGYCLRELNNMWQSNVKKKDFLPDLFFSDDGPRKGIEYNGEPVSESSLPNIYQKDWPLISRKYRELVGYQCENPDCTFKNLSPPNLHRYLHCHHVNFIRSDNSYSNLKALCIYCHAQIPLHDRLKKWPDYNKFLHLSGRA